jgi:hypothetical protein
VVCGRCGCGERSVQARLAAEKHHHAVAFGGNEAEEEHVAAAAVVALQGCFAQRTAEKGRE